MNLALICRQISSLSILLSREITHGCSSFIVRAVYRAPSLPGIACALDPRDILALNNTRVVPARLNGRREATGGKWEGLFLQDVGNGLWEVLAKTGGRLVPGETIIIGSGLHLVLESKSDAGSWLVRPRTGSSYNTQPTLALLDHYGQTPLPPYIRKGKAGDRDRVCYQTVFAQRPGSIAAPTAGLHFTENTFRELASRGIGWTNLTLHVGAGRSCR